MTGRSLYRWPAAARVRPRRPEDQVLRARQRLAPRVREKFVAEVQRITWAYKLAESTIHLRRQRRRFPRSRSSRSTPRATTSARPCSPRSTRPSSSRSSSRSAAGEARRRASGWSPPTSSSAPATPKLGAYFTHRLAARDCRARTAARRPSTCRASTRRCSTPLTARRAARRARTCRTSPRRLDARPQARTRDRRAGAASSAPNRSSTARSSCAGSSKTAQQRSTELTDPHRATEEAPWTS